MDFYSAVKLLVEVIGGRFGALLWLNHIPSLL